VQAYDYDTQELIYSVTVYSSNTAEVQLTKVEPNSVYTLRVTGSGNMNQVGNTVSCIAVTGQCYFSCDFLVIVIVKVVIFQVFQLQF